MVTSDARAGFLTRTCPCAECAEWRAARKRSVKVPAPPVEPCRVQCAWLVENTSARQEEGRQNRDTARAVVLHFAAAEMIRACEER